MCQSKKNNFCVRIDQIQPSAKSQSVPKVEIGSFIVANLMLMYHMSILSGLFENIRGDK